MKQLVWIGWLWLVGSVAANAQGYKIEGHIKGMGDSTLMLAHWYGSGSFFPKDTALADASGHVVFEGSKPLPQGLYLIVPASKRDVGLHLIINQKQRFSFTTDLANIVKTMMVRQSEENQLFYAYQQQLNRFNEEAQAIRSTPKPTGSAQTDSLSRREIAALSQRVQAYQQQFQAQNAGSFAAKLFRATAEPVVPPAPKNATGRTDSNWVFNYYKAHFWDGYDWNDERMLRTPVLQTKLNRYIKDLTVQRVDSLAKEADWLVGKTGSNPDVRSYIIWYITSQYERPKVLGTDGVFIHMVEKYWLTGVYSVSDTATLKTLRERVAVLKPLLVGKPFPFFTVADTLRHPLDLPNLKADYTVMFFYAPHCGHCRETTPKLKKLADQYSSKGVRVVAIAVDDSEADWRKFIREFNLSHFIHGYDFTHTLNFQRQYDVLMTPTFYVLDKRKQIIARQLPFEQLEDFIRFHQKQQASTESAKKPLSGK